MRSWARAGAHGLPPGKTQLNLDKGEPTPWKRGRSVIVNFKCSRRYALTTPHHAQLEPPGFTPCVIIIMRVRTCMIVLPTVIIRML